MAEQLDANFFEMRIGRSTYDPFFIGSNFPYGDVTYLFQSGCLVECDEFCCECNEPTGHRQNPDYCFWCEIDDEVARENQDAIEAMRDLE